MRYPPALIARTRALPNAPQTAVEALVNAARNSRAEYGVIARSGRLTWSELEVITRNVAAMLHTMGIGPGDRVACSLGNDIDIVVAFFGVVRTGALWVGVNAPLAPPEKKFLLEDSGAALFIATAATIATIEPLWPNGTAVAVDDPDGPWRRSWSTKADAELDTVGPFDAAAIAYTSGTTGTPKGAVHAHRNLIVPTIVRRDERYGPVPRRVGQCLPLTLLNLMLLGPVNAAVNQATFVAMDRIDAEGVAQWIETERIDSVIVAAPTARDLLERDDIPGEIATSIIKSTCGGSDFPDWYRDAWLAKFGSTLEGGYGMTEAPNGVVWEDGRPPAGACGKAAPHINVTIRDEHGALMPTGVEGEICIEPADAGPFAHTYTPMMGYWNRPEANQRSLVGSRYRTGDVGKLDGDDWLYVLDRRSDLILRGGGNVYPAEVERVVLTHSQVAACAVVGRPHERLGHEVVLVYEPIDGYDVGEDGSDLVDQLRRLCVQNLAKYKIPAEIVHIDKLPRNAMGKVVKPEVVRWLAATETAAASAK
jgi:long-chain acyl-CoA synthetase